MSASSVFHDTHLPRAWRRLAALAAAGVALACPAAPAIAGDTAILQPDTMRARVAACTGCHGGQGKAGADGYYPRLAGKPRDYLYHQLLNFRDGSRQYRPMAHLLAGLPDDYLLEIAAYFAAQRVPYPPPARPAAPAGVLEQGRALAMRGDAARGLPACAACHGAALNGLAPAIPGLLGLPRDYIAAQIGSWKNGLRHAGAPDCMGDVARALTPRDIGALAAWLSSRPVADPYAPDPAGSLNLPAECGSQAPRETAPAAILAAPSGTSRRQIAQGRYLARLGHCMACHTTPGGQAYAGGTAISTPFGTLYGPNITPDPQTGIGGWDADDFWRALHDGVSKDGSPLYPAFPYTAYTRVWRADSDALFAYLRTVPPVRQASRPHDLAFPYSRRGLLAFWRALYFQPGVYEADPGESAQWNRGRYLVEGLGHCAACHAPRNRLGAVRADAGLAGGLIAGQDWYAPPLDGGPGTQPGGWSAQDIAMLLQTGMARHATAIGPMAEVVRSGSQYLSDEDALAIGTYLKSLPPAPAGGPARGVPATAAVMEHGGKLYGRHCAQCHQDQGQGSGAAWPALADNPTVTAPSAVNAIRIVIEGGFAPATAANPRPHGMPPFGPVLDDRDIAALVSYIRASWGNQAGGVTPFEVGRAREAAMLN